MCSSLIKRHSSALAALTLSALGTFYFSQKSTMPRPNIAAVRAANAGISLATKRCVVVGGTSGIGHGIAKRLAQAGCSVTIVGRTERGIVEEMTTASPNHADCKHSFVPVNAYLLSSVNAAVDTIISSHDKVDYLVQSQGMATIQGFAPSEEGLDQKLALHVFSRALFNRGLQPLMEKSEDPRSLSVLSAGVHSSYADYEKDPELSLGSYGIKSSADSAGFYNDIIADEFSQLYPKITYMHAAPGFIATRWGTEMPTLVRWLVRGLQKFGRSQEDCGEYMVSGLLNPDHKGGFFLLDQYGAATAKVTSLHEQAKSFVFKHIISVLDAGKAVAKPTSKQ